MRQRSPLRCYINETKNHENYMEIISPPAFVLRSRMNHNECCQIYERFSLYSLKNWHFFHLKKIVFPRRILKQMKKEVAEKEKSPIILCNCLSFILLEIFVSKENRSRVKDWKRIAVHCKQNLFSF